jgi:hypothetical protein
VDKPVYNANIFRLNQIDKPSRLTQGEKDIIISICNIRGIFVRKVTKINNRLIICERNMKVIDRDGVCTTVLLCGVVGAGPPPV